jgi:hypothetical protein
MASRRMIKLWKIRHGTFIHMPISNFDPTTVTAHLLSIATTSGESTSISYLLRIPNHHASNKCLPGGRAGTARGPPSFQVTQVVCLNSHPSTKLFLLFFALVFLFCHRMCTQHPFRFATCLSLCGLRKIVTAFGWFDWSSGNGSWWRWDLQCCQLPGGVIFQQKVTPTVCLRQSSDSTYRLRNL